MVVIDKVKNVVINNKKRSIRFDQIANEWLEYKKNMIKQSTYCNYLFIVEKYLKPKLKNVKITKVQNYNNFVQELSNKFSSKTVKDITNVLKAILKFYEQEYNCTLNVKRISVPKGERKRIRVLNQKDRRKLQKYCLESNDLKCLGVFISLNTGLRIGEVCALKWENVDLEERQIYVKKTIQRIYNEKEKKSKIIIDTPKTQCSIRAVPISKKLYEVLRPLKKIYKLEDYVLTGSSDRFIEPRVYQYNFKLILQDSKVRPCKFHILRHTFATNCIEVGMDAKSLSEILGHADVNITLNRYVHSSDKIKQKYLEKLE